MSSDERDRNPELESILDQIEDFLDADDEDAALPLAKKAVRKFPSEPDAWSVLAETLEALGDLEGAIVAFGKAVELDPGWAAVHAHVGYLHLEMGAIGAASRCIEQAFDIDDLEPEASYAFALLCEIEGEHKRAEDFYGQAATLNPDRYHEPCRVSMDRFGEMATAAVKDMPDKIHEFLGDLPIEILDMPERDERGRFVNSAPLLLGECVGTHMEERGALDLDSLTPARIMLYKLNLERVSVDEEDLAEQVRITVLHEVLHFLGLDEDEVAARGLR